MNPSSAVPRREFLSTAAKAVVTVGLFDLNVWPGPRHTALAISTVTIDLTLPANSALTAVGGSQYVALAESPDFDMIVIRNSATAVSAFLSRCTHAGGVVDLPVSHVCTCPLHGSTFDESGNVTKGPAKTNLDKFKAVLNGSVITISTLTGVLGRTGATPGPALRVVYEQEARTLAISLPDANAPHRVRLLDLAGRLLREERVEGAAGHLFRLPPLERGTYILEVLSPASRYHYRFTAL